MMVLQSKLHDHSTSVCVGRIGRPHGLRGCFRFFSFTEDPASVFNFKNLWDESFTRSFRLTCSSRAADFFIASAEGVDSRDSVALLSGLCLYVSRADLVDLSEGDSFYYCDLIGLSVLDEGGTPVGVIEGVDNYGAGDLLKIRKYTGGGAFLCFSHDMVKDVDLHVKKCVVLTPMALEFLSNIS